MLQSVKSNGDRSKLNVCAKGRICTVYLEKLTSFQPISIVDAMLRTSTHVHLLALQIRGPRLEAGGCISKYHISH